MERIYMTAFLVAIAHLSEIDKRIALENHKKFLAKHTKSLNSNKKENE